MIMNEMSLSKCKRCKHRGTYFCTKSTPCETKTYTDFCNHMYEDCGMLASSDGAIFCCECEEPIYEEDHSNHDWKTCPVCGYSIV